MAGEESRNFVDSRLQLGVEATPGQSVAATRIIDALEEFQFNPKRPVKRGRTRGRKYATRQSRGKEYAEGSLGGGLCFNGILYLVAGLIPVAAPVGIGASGAFSWAGTPLVTGRDTPKTYTGELGDIDAADRYPFLQLTSLALQLGQDESKMSSNFFANQPTRNVALTAAGVQRVLARDVDRSHVNVYLTSNFAQHGQAAALLTDADAESFNIGEKFKPRWVHNRATSRGFKSRSEIATEATFGVTSEYSAQARGWSTNLDHDDLMYFMLDIQGEQIGLNGATPVYEQIKIEACGKFDEPKDQGDQDGSWAYEYPFCALDHPDNQLGVPYKITIVNKLSAL